MSMEIHIRDYRFPMSIGAWASEQVAPQEVALTLILTIDGTRPAQTDALEDTVDYFALLQAITARLQARHHHLLEHSVHEILDLLMEHPPILAADVTLVKPHILPGNATAAVRAVRVRGG